MWIHSIVNVLLLFLLVLSSVDFLGESPRFIFCIFAHRWLCESPSTEADLMCPSSFRTSLVHVRVCEPQWRQTTANCSHTKMTARHRILRMDKSCATQIKKKKMWCNESHVVGAPKKKSKRRKPRPYTRIYTTSDSANPHRQTATKDTEFYEASIHPFPPHPSNRRDAISSLGN